MRAAINWTPELEDAICAAIAINPKGLEHICKANPHFPCADKIYEYRRENTEFSEKYTRAKADQCLVLADEIIGIADTCDNENWKPAQVRIDARKWLAGKLAPKIFGEKIQQEHSGEINLGLAEVIAEARKRAGKPE